MRKNYLPVAILASAFWLGGCQSPPPQAGPSLAPTSTPSSAALSPDGKWVVRDGKGERFDALWEIKGSKIDCTPLAGGPKETKTIEPSGGQFLIKGGNGETPFALVTPYEAMGGRDIVRKPTLYAHRISETPASLLGEWQEADGRRSTLQKSEIRTQSSQSPTPYLYLPCDSPTFMLLMTNQPDELVLGRIQEDGSLLLGPKPGMYGICLFREGKRPAWIGTATFTAYDSLLQAGSGHTTEDLHPDDLAYQEYQLRFKNGFAFGVKAMLAQNAELIRNFKQGKYASKPQELATATKEFADALKDSLQQFDDKKVPLVLDSFHKKIAKAHGLCYASLVALKEADELKGEERTRRLGESEQNLQEASQLVDAGLKEFARSTPP